MFTFLMQHVINNIFCSMLNCFICEEKTSYGTSSFTSWQLSNINGFLFYWFLFYLLEYSYVKSCRSIPFTLVDNTFAYMLFFILLFLTSQKKIAIYWFHDFFVYYLTFDCKTSHSSSYLLTMLKLYIFSHPLYICISFI